MKTILFIDDKATIGTVLQVYLGQENNLVYVEDPLKAIDWLNQGNDPDLVITDIRMPLMTGKEFLHYMKSNPLYSHIPVVILTSEYITTERIKLLEEGAADYIVKPFNPMELKARVKRYLV